MVNLLVLITILAPILTALTAILKQYIPTKYHALIPVILGIILGPLASIFAPSLTIIQLLWAGLLAGLTSGGFYSVQNIPKK